MARRAHLSASQACRDLRAASGAQLADSFVVLRAGRDGAMDFATVDEAAKAGAVTFNYGAFIEAVLDFLFVTIAVFLLFKLISRVKVQMRSQVQGMVGGLAEGSVVRKGEQDSV